MAVPFTLPLQSQVTDENALTTLADVKNEINTNNITTNNNTFTGSNTFQGPVIFENQDAINVKAPYIQLWNLNAVWNVTPSTRKEVAYSCKDKNGVSMGALSLARETNGDTTISFHLHAANGAWSQPGQVLTQIAKADGTMESRASEPPADANDSRIATCKFVNDKISTIPGADLTGYLQNVATGENSVAIEGSTETAVRATAIGFNSVVTKTESTSIGYSTTTNSRRNVALGAQAGIYNSNGASALGYGSQVQSAESAIQIGYGKNTTPHTLAVGLGVWDASTRPTTEEEGEYILLQSDGTIPAARIANTLSNYQEKLNSTDTIKVYPNADNFTVIGDTVAIDQDKMATNFTSSTSYLTASNVIFTRADIGSRNSFEIVTAFKFSGSFLPTGVQLFSIKPSADSPASAVGIRVIDGVLSSIVAGASITGTTQLSADSKIYAKLKFINGTGYFLYYSADGKNWSLEGSSNSLTLAPVQLDTIMNIGINTPTYTQIFLRDTYVNIDGEEVWRAATVSSASLTAPVLQSTTIPTTDTIGSIGQILVDTATGTGYMCVGTANGAYAWKQITYSPVGTEYVLETGNWNTENNSIEINIPGLTIGTPMWIAPTISEDNSNELNYATHGIRLKAQQADSITLSCTIIPTENISITIIR